MNRDEGIFWRHWSSCRLSCFLDLKTEKYCIKQHIPYVLVRFTQTAFLICRNQKSFVSKKCSSNSGWSERLRWNLPCFHISISRRQNDSEVFSATSLLQDPPLATDATNPTVAVPCGLRSGSAAAWLLESAVSNPAEGMTVISLVWYVLCRQRPLRRADHSLRGVLPDVCVCVLT